MEGCRKLCSGSKNTPIWEMDLLGCVHTKCGCAYTMRFSQAFHRTAGDSEKAEQTCSCLWKIRVSEHSLPMWSRTKPRTITPNLVEYRAPIYKRPISASVPTVQCNQANLSRVAIRAFLLVGYFCLGRILRIIALVMLFQTVLQVLLPPVHCKSIQIIMKLGGAAHFLWRMPPAYSC
jgi:hypothetical protein